MPSKWIACAMAAGWTSLMLMSNAQAGPLTPEACGKLLSEIKSLEDGGVRGLLTRGTPETVVASLSAVDRQKLKKLFDAEAHFKFRCPQDRPLIVLREETVEESQDQVVPGEDDPQTPQQKAPAQPKAPQKSAPKSAAAAQPTKAQPAPTPRSKADDAYRPPQPAGAGATVAPVKPQAPQ